MESFCQKNGSAVKETRTLSSLPPPPPINAGLGGRGKAKKKSVGVRMWMRFDWTGATEAVECDKSTIINRASVSARDLRIAFSHSAKILVREKAIVVNLEVINAIVTAQEVLMLDPLHPVVLTLIDRLKQQFPQMNGSENVLQASSLDDQEGAEGLESGLPFEFQVLEIALEVVCSFIDSNVAALETQAWAFLDELTKKVSIENLTYLRSLKSNLTHLVARVQKVRDQIEHLLDNKGDMANLYLTRKWIQSQQTAPNNKTNLHMLKSNRRSANMVREEDDVDDVEMMLEVYFMQLEEIRKKILMMKEHIDSTEAYVKIEQSNQRNGLIELKMSVDISNFAITAGTLVVNLFGMNIPIPLYSTPGVFGYIVGSVVALCIVLFMVVFGYAKSKKLLH